MTFVDFDILYSVTAKIVFHDLDQLFVGKNVEMFKSLKWFRDSVKMRDSFIDFDM